LNFTRIGPGLDGYWSANDLQSNKDVVALKKPGEESYPPLPEQAIRVEVMLFTLFEAFQAV
jgi:hypothetical protein